jgi:hypothetical protein
VAVLAEAKSETEVYVIRQRDATMRLMVGWFGRFLWPDKTAWSWPTPDMERPVKLF